MVSKNNLLLVIFILLFGALLRFIWLDRIPSAIGGDELVYILEAKSVALTGKDLTGTWNPLSVLLFKYPPDEKQAELPYLINIPVVGAFQFSLFTARVTSAVLSVLTILGLYFLVRELFNTHVAIASAFIMAINPWQIYIGRTAYDMVPAVCFYLWAMYVSIVKKGKLLLWSILLYILAFYSYIGTKIILLPIIVVISLYIWREFSETSNKKQIRIFVLVIFVFICFFAYSLLSTSGSSRLSEIISLNDPVISGTVDTMRKVSIRSPLVDMYVNKYTILATIMLTKLSRIFSTDYLFAYGDQFYSLYTHGLFYFVDASFLLIGIVTMFLRARRKMLYVSLFVLIGSIPHLIHGASTEDFSPHLVMLFPFLIIIIGYGIVETIRFTVSRFKKVVAISIVGIYILSLGNFLQIYWFQNSLYGNFDFPLRTMSKYLQIQNPDRQVIVYTQRTGDVYKKHLFYSDSIQKNTVKIIQQSLQTNEIKIHNIQFLGCNRDMVVPLDTTVVYESSCGKPLSSLKNLKITRLKDGGEEFNIFNDTKCEQYELKPYPDKFLIGDLDIERLSAKRFCETFVTR